MSHEASIAAWKSKPEKSSHKFVLVAMAERAGESALCWPSIKRLELDTLLNRKTVIAALDALEDAGFIIDTGERRGATKKVKVYQLQGVNHRENEAGSVVKNSTKNGTVKKNSNTTENNPKNGTVIRESEQSQKRNSSKNGTVPFLEGNSTVFSSKQSQKRYSESERNQKGIYNSLSSAREDFSDDTSVTNVDEFDARYAQAVTDDDSDHCQVSDCPAPEVNDTRSRRFCMQNDWQPDYTFQTQALTLGLDLQHLLTHDHDQGDQLEQLLEEFRTYWIEQRPDDRATQRYWQQRLINSLKRSLNSRLGGGRYAERQNTHTAGRQDHRVAYTDAIFGAPGCESLTPDEQAEIFGERFVQTHEPA